MNDDHDDDLKALEDAMRQKLGAVDKKPERRNARGTVLPKRILINKFQVPGFMGRSDPRWIFIAEEADGKREEVFDTMDEFLAKREVEYYQSQGVPVEVL